MSVPSIALFPPSGTSLRPPPAHYREPLYRCIIDYHGYTYNIYSKVFQRVDEPPRLGAARGSRPALSLALRLIDENRLSTHLADCILRFATHKKAAPARECRFHSTAIPSSSLRRYLAIQTYDRPPPMYQRSGDELQLTSEEHTLRNHGAVITRR